ncbi:MAG: preprotein translocase subunit YajC [Deltaproteobacteria bacterium]|jgi:preprotein translocase subunit YajC|nr:preprotein translocase subunit YajC [Deltaproteobacteria bacterium]
MWWQAVAWAQQAAGAPAEHQQNFLAQLLQGPGVPLALMVVIIYFFLIRPQTKKASDHQRMLGALKRNDEVVTTGGMLGKITELGDKIVVLEVAPGVRVRVERQQIAGPATHSKAPRKEKG